MDIRAEVIALANWQNVEKAYAYGGPIGAVLALLGLVALLLILAKLLSGVAHLFHRDDPHRRSLNAIENGLPLAEAISELARSSHPIARMLHAGAVAAINQPMLAEQPGPKSEVAMRETAELQLATRARFNRSLELIGITAPMLGLLGTVIGMIKAFQTIEVSSGDALLPAVLAGGVWEALLTTALGLAIAIPAVVVSNLSDARLERLKTEMATAADRFVAACRTKQITQFTPVVPSERGD